MSAIFCSRRRFLAQLSASAAMGLVPRLPGQWLRVLSPSEPIREIDDALLRKLALTAVEAASVAGATFADVRVAAGRTFNVTCAFDQGQSPNLQMAPPGLTLTVSYGIRAIVSGAWGIATGHEPAPDAIAAVARTAVARARANRRRRPRQLELASTPIVPDGRWATPIEQDPFAVPVGEQADLQLEALADVSRISEVIAASVNFHWQRTKRAFASSEGTFQLQRIELGFPSAAVAAHPGERHAYATEGVRALHGGGYGYEAVTRVNLCEELRQAAERASARAKELTRPIPAEVGRYDLVCSASTVAQLFAATLGEAVNAERVLGYEANRSGTSFAAPPSEMLGRLEVGSRLLSVRGDRSQPHGATTVGWDDEGVKPKEFMIVEDGVLLAYPTNRQTAAELADWYRSRGEPVHSFGCASGAGTRRPTIQLPNLIMQPAAEDVSVEDLISDTERGFYIESVRGRSDHQLLNGQFAAGDVREIRNGRLGDRVRHLAFQFITPNLWAEYGCLRWPVERGAPSARYRPHCFARRDTVTVCEHEDRARALPASERAEHRGDRMRTDAWAGASEILTAEECEALGRRILARVTSAAAQVEISSSARAGTEFARGDAHVAELRRTESAQLVIEDGGRRAWTLTTRLDDEGLDELVAEVEALLREHRTPREVGVLSPQRYPEGPQIYYDSIVAVMAAEAQAALVRRATDATEAANLIGAGDLMLSASARSVLNTNGLSAYERSTYGEFSLTARTLDGQGSGWGWSGFEDWSRVDVDEVMARAVDLGRRSANPVAVEPGRYTVVLEPAAVAALIQPIIGYPTAGWSAEQADQGGTVFAGEERRSGAGCG